MHENDTIQLSVHTSKWRLVKSAISNFHHRKTVYSTTECSEFCHNSAMAVSGENARSLGLGLGFVVGRWWIGLAVTALRTSMKLPYIGPG